MVAVVGAEVVGVEVGCGVVGSPPGTSSGSCGDSVYVGEGVGVGVAVGVGVDSSLGVGCVASWLGV